MNAILEDSRIREAHRLFTNKGMLRREVLRSEIALSWARCQVLGLSPDRIRETPVSPEEYHLARNDAQTLIQCAAPVFENFLSISNFNDLNLSLSDGRGLVLVDWIQRSDRFAYRQGLTVLEERLGTNGAALAINSKRPYTVHGSEHFVEGLQGYVTFGIPLIGPDDRMLGVIAGSSDFNGFNNDLMERLEHVGSLIIGGIQRHQSLQVTVQLKDHYAAALDALPDALLCFDRYGQILHGNRVAEELFAHKILDLRKFNIRELIRMDQPIRLESLLNGRIPENNCEGYYEAQDGYRPALLQYTAFRESNAARMAMIKITPNEAFRGYIHYWIGPKTVYSMDDLVGRSASLIETRRKARGIAENQGCCLIFGESGTGKKVLAQVIHAESSRSEAPFYYLNCASVPKRILDLELFGQSTAIEDREIGNRMGLLELADGGTLYLDNIGELPLPTQVRLLKFIDEKRFSKLNSSQDRIGDVRIIGSSKQELILLVQRGFFRQELYNRFQMNRLDTVPLRYRKEDLRLLVDYLMKEILVGKEGFAVAITEEFYERITEYDWPGNIRELQKVLSVLVHRIKDGESLSGEHLEQFSSDWLSVEDRLGPMNLEQVERNTIVQAIDRSAGNLSHAAKMLGIGRSTLYRKMERYRIEVSQNGSDF